MLRREAALGGTGVTAVTVESCVELVQSPERRVAVAVSRWVPIDAS